MGDQGYFLLVNGHSFKWSNVWKVLWNQKRASRILHTNLCFKSMVSRMILGKVDTTIPKPACCRKFGGSPLLLHAFTRIAVFGRLIGLPLREPQTLHWKMMQTARNPVCEASNKIQQISYHQGKELSFKSHTAQKPNMDTQNDSLEKVVLWYKYGHFWYLCYISGGVLPGKETTKNHHHTIRHHSPRFQRKTETLWATASICKSFSWRMVLPAKRRHFQPPRGDRPSLEGKQKNGWWRKNHGRRGKYLMNYTSYSWHVSL